MIQLKPNSSSKTLTLPQRTTFSHSQSPRSEGEVGLNGKRRRFMFLPLPNVILNGNNGILPSSSSTTTSISAPSIRHNVENPNYSSRAVPDISDEIIVINKESTAEALIALSSGFPADSLTEEEIDAGVVPVVGGIEQVNFILIRNHIIAKWREYVSTWITKEMFIDAIPKHCHTLLDSAYNYLVSHGYINFGVAPAIKEKIPAEPNKVNCDCDWCRACGAGCSTAID
jgi:hypothetical protein